MTFSNHFDEKELVCKQAKLEDSNLAHYGSEEHHDLFQEIAKKEKAWKNAGEHEYDAQRATYLNIWTVHKKFNVKRWHNDRYGEFYNGDCYIILVTLFDTDVGANAKKKYEKSYRIHIWLGQDCTQDKMYSMLQSS